MDTKIFKEGQNKNQDAQLLGCMTRFIKRLSKKMRSLQSKKYKFTGNRMFAKRARGNNYITKLPNYYRLSIIKSRIVKNKPWQNLDQKILSISEHIKYLTRNEVELDGKPAQFFDDHNNEVDGKKFAEDLAADRHHFRFIVSPQDGNLIDLKRHARDLVKQMEVDLGVKLTWIGVVHKNTDNPHVHLVIKGTERDGRDLIIKPDYITHGLRSRSSDLITRELGPRTEISIMQSQIKSLQQDRLINIDYKIAECAKAHGGKFTPHLFKNPQDVKNASIRIKHLQKLNLAATPSYWPKNFYQLDPNLIEKLKDLAANKDIYKRIARFGDEARFYTPKAGSITGKIIDKGLADELNNNYYVILESNNGHKWYVDLSKSKNVEPLKIGQHVAVDSKTLKDSRGQSQIVIQLNQPKLTKELTR